MLSIVGCCPIVDCDGSVEEKGYWTRGLGRSVEKEKDGRVRIRRLWNLELEFRM